MTKQGKLGWLIAIIIIVGSVRSFAQDLLVSGGNNVSTIICANGFVYTWGNNTGGLLGNGSGAANVTSPLVVNFPTTDPYFNSISTSITIKAVDAGSGGHFIALDCYGGAWSWGNNGGATGITGTGSAAASVSTTSRVLKGLTPGGVSIHASLTNYLVDVKYISGGNDNSYAIMNTGEAVAWGRNDKGQLGNGTNTNSATPVYILTGPGTRLTGVIQVEAGDETAYALVDTDGDGIGTVYSWGAGTGTFGGTCMLGRNAAGTANNLNETANDNYARPVRNADGSPLTGIVSISAGDILCLALDATGYVWAWGNGGWGDCTGQGAAVGNHSDPRKVVAGEWGTTAGAGFGEVYLKAKAISGGQGYAMAVSTDGVPVAWGNNGACGSASSGGHLGNGGGASRNAPAFIRRSAGTYDNNAVSISDGDTWGFYTTSTNQIYTWGNNANGQLGIGSVTCSNYATEFTLPPCTFPAPKPTASITPRNQSVCASTFSSVVLNSQFIISAALAPDYRITWYKDAVQVQVGLASVAANLTYTATATGTYKVKVEYIGTDAPCSPYLPKEDQIIISPYIQNYTVPSGLTFCGALTPYVTGLGKYNWFKDASGGSSLASTLKNNPASIPKASANAPVAGVYTVYVEETQAFVGNVGPVTPTSCTGIASNDNNNYRNIIIKVTDPQIIIDTVTIWVKGETGVARSWNWQINAYPTKSNGSGKTVGDFSVAPVASGPLTPMLNPSNGGAWVETKIPVNITLAGNGVSYAIAVPKGLQTGGTNNPNLADFNCSLFPKVDDISTGGPYVTATKGSDYYTNDKTEWGPIGNIHFTTSQHFCDRVPVTLTEVCPCQPPTSVSLTPSTTTTLCQGANLTIAGVVDIAALTPQNASGLYYYIWYKNGLPITSYSTTYVDLTFTGILPSGSGTYTLRVEDGNPAPASTGTSCYKTASVTIVVNATTVAGAIATSQTICNGNTAAAFTSTTAASGGSGTYAYQWQSSPDGSTGWADIGSATSATYSPGAVTTLTYYRRNVTSGVCPLVSSNVVSITVNPSLTAGTIDADQTICSSTAPNSLTEITAATGGTGSYTYQWQSSANGSTGWVNATGTSTNATYSPAALTATIYYRRVVSSGTCTSQNSNVIQITVLTGLIGGTITANQTICNNSIPAALTSTAVSSGGTGTYTYSWEQSINAGVSWSVASALNTTGYSPPALTTTTVYRRVVVSGIGTCNTAYSNNVTITVYGALTVGAIATDQGICSGQTPATLTNSTAPTGGTALTYSWERSTNAGSSWSIVAAASSSSYSPPSLTATTMYRRIVTSGNSCGSLTSAPVTITITPLSPVSVTINNPGATCAASPMSFTATPVNEGITPTYQWYRNNIVVAGATSASYNPSSLNNGDNIKVILTSSITCVSGNPSTSNIVPVSVLSNVTPTVVINNPGQICVGDNVNFTATTSGGGATPVFQWYLNNNPVGSNATVYTNSLNNGDKIHVVMTTSLSCATTANGTSNQITMTVKTIPTPQIVGNDTTFCSGQAVTYTANVGSGILTWNRDGSVVSNASSLTVTTSGTYTLTENNGACATTSAPVTVVVLPTPIANAGPDQYVEEGTATSLNASGGVIYVWTPSTGLSSTSTPTPSLVAKNNITYTVNVFDATQTCSSFDEVTIFVEKPINIPNAITPNGDGNNDGWEIANINSFPNCVIEIYNRWGTLIWKSTGYSIQWDGSNYRNSEVLPDGTYFYIIDLKSKVFKEPYTGYVQIVK